MRNQKEPSRIPMHDDEHSKEPVKRPLTPLNADEKEHDQDED
jgi:hypothetical protein